MSLSPHAVVSYLEVALDVHPYFPFPFALPFPLTFMLPLSPSLFLPPFTISLLLLCKVHGYSSHRYLSRGRRTHVMPLYALEMILKKDDL
jgi:hypothetical protein